jgi:hypothetical protein
MLIFEITAAAAINKNAGTYPAKFLIEKTAATKRKVIMILYLGSILWINDSPGKYCPRVISLSITSAR